jgi:hypothetical protein
MESMVLMPPKPHQDMKVGKRKAKGEPKERAASKRRIHKGDWLVAPLQNGCMCLNLGDAETVFVGILQVPESRVKDYLDAFNGSAGARGHQLEGPMSRRL